MICEICETLDAKFHTEADGIIRDLCGHCRLSIIRRAEDYREERIIRTRSA